MKKTVSFFGVSAMVMMIGMSSGFAQTQATTPQPGVAAGTEQSIPATSTAAEKAKSTGMKAVEGVKAKSLGTTKPTVPGATDKTAPAAVDKVKTPEVKPVETGKPEASTGVKPSVDEMKGKASAPEETKKQ